MGKGISPTKKRSSGGPNKPDGEIAHYLAGDLAVSRPTPEEEEAEYESTLYAGSVGDLHFETAGSVDSLSRLTLDVSDSGQVSIKTHYGDSYPILCSPKLHSQTSSRYLESRASSRFSTDQEESPSSHKSSRSYSSTESWDQIVDVAEVGKEELLDDEPFVEGSDRGSEVRLDESPFAPIYHSEEKKRGLSRQEKVWPIPLPKHNGTREEKKRPRQSDYDDSRKNGASSF